MIRQAEATSVIQIKSSGASEVKAGLQITVLDSSDWDKNAAIEHLLGEMSGNRLEQLQELAILSALRKFHFQQKKAATYLGVSDRVVCYQVKKLRAKGLMDEKQLLLTDGEES